MSAPAPTVAALPDACAHRGDVVRDYAERAGITVHTSDIGVIAWRLAWDAPAAGEYPRPMLQDAADLAELRPDLAADVWHHVAGATILGPLCCHHPAGHRDALTAIAREIREA